MNIKKIAALAVTMVLILTAAACTPAVPSAAPTPTPESAATPEPTETLEPTPAPTIAPSATATAVPSATPAPPLTVEDNPLIYSSDYVDVKVSCPEISGMQDAAVQNGVNEGVYNYLSELAQSVEDTSVRDSGDREIHDVYRIDTDFFVERNDGRVLSVRIDITTYEGGANVGMDAAFVNVINGKNASQPTLEELFKGEIDYEAVLNKKVNELIAANPESDVFSFSGVTSGQWYYLTNSALVLVFPTYSIAPRAYGMPEFTIPFADISQYLIKEIQ